jgi:hypothetical protein
MAWLVGHVCTHRIESLNVATLDYLLGALLRYCKLAQQQSGIVCLPLEEGKTVMISPSRMLRCAKKDKAPRLPKRFSKEVISHSMHGRWQISQCSI